MEFGPWVAKKRKMLGMGIEQLANRAHVDDATISRIENSKNQATFLTAISICRALNASTEDLSQLLEVNAEKLLATFSHDYADSIEVLYDAEVVELIRLFAKDDGTVREWLAELLNAATAYQMSVREGAARRGYSGFPPFDTSDVDRFLVSIPLINLELLYPMPSESKQIYRWYQAGGALSLADAGAYLRLFRTEQELKQSDLVKAGIGSVNVISRLETGLVDRLKFEDVWQLDHFLNVAGDILGIYWRAVDLKLQVSERSPFDDIFVNDGEWVIAPYDFATFFLTLWQWVEQSSEADQWRVIMKERIGSHGKD